MTTKLTPDYYIEPVSAGDSLVLRRELVTADQASWILANLNKYSSGVRKRKIYEYLKKFESGQWIASPKQYLGFLGGSGKLCDGQHRLLAQVQLGLDLEYYILRGLDPNFFRFRR